LPRPAPNRGAQPGTMRRGSLVPTFGVLYRRQ
jgi:hypothetical protein